MDDLSVRRSPLHTVTYAHRRGVDIAAVLPSLRDWDDSGQLSDLHDRLHLVTAACDGLLVGYVAVDARDGLIRIVAEHVVPGADPTSEVARALTRLAVDVASSPWGDVEVGRASLTVPHLLRDGWHPIADGTRRPGPTITMSGAGVA